MPYNLLLVDDDDDFRREMRSCFDDFEVTEAPDGETAISILKKPNSIDIVLLDQIMPGLKGTEALVEMKAINPGLKVVILTGSNSKSVVISALKCRADDYLEKPVDIGEARAAIMKLLGDRDSAGIPDTGDMAAKIRKVKKFVERNFDKKVTLEDAARHAGTSPKYLSKAFEKQEGSGFSGFKTAVKIKKSKELLRRGYNVSQVSDMLAYSGPEAFVRAFKNAVGLTPARYKSGKAVKAGKKRGRNGSKRK